jgi:predicted GIY-YIG superfamily endonuclease
MAYIYKIEIGDYIYYGSTTDIKRRQREHNCKLKSRDYYLYQKCRELNILKIKCIQIEKCKEDNRIEREGYYIRNCNKDILLNKQIAGSTRKETQKIYRDNNKDKQQAYRDNNKDKKKEYHQAKITCECGCIISRNSIYNHLKSQKHLNPS